MSRGPSETKIKHAREFNRALFTVIDEIVNYMNQDQRERMLLVKTAFDAVLRRHDVTSVIERIREYNLLVPYGDHIQAHNEAFFMTTDYAAHLAALKLTAEHRKKASTWLEFIEMLKEVWKLMNTASRGRVWAAIDIIYIEYLEYVVGA